MASPDREMTQGAMFTKPITGGCCDPQRPPYSEYELYVLANLLQVFKLNDERL